MSIFSWVCGQTAEHTWAPAGELLPVCQRCTGFYCGAAIALVLLIWLRPQIDFRYRWLHTMLVLAMAPFGFHLVSHGAVVRTLSGCWFGFGVVGLLWILPGRRFFTGKKDSIKANRLHLGLGLTSLFLLPVAAFWGGSPAAEILPWLALSGLVVFALLLATNIGFVLLWLISPIIRHLARQAI